MDWFIENLPSINSFAGVASTVMAFLGLIMTYLQFKKEHKKEKNLYLHKDEQTKLSMKYYIPTRGRVADYFSRNKSRDLLPEVKMIPYFSKEIFRDPTIQYIIVLGDSGMGKTTFVLKLFNKCYKKIFGKYEVFLIPFYLTNALEIIKDIKNKSETILLLDGLEEVPHVMKDYTRQLKKIFSETEQFYKVVITCRTQFFPDIDSELGYPGKILAGKGTGRGLIKCYISPFNEQEIDRYLRKKYNSVLESDKVRRAKSVIVKCPDLMVRPMLLAFIDNLIIDSAKEFQYVFEVYEELVMNWIVRESADERYGFQLFKFSLQTAKYMFLHETAYITEKEIEKICAHKKLKFDKVQAKSKSLLSRGTDGNYKFAHRSIYEYLLARIALRDMEFCRELVSRGFSGYDLTKSFLREMSLKYLKKFSPKLDHSLIQAGDFRYLQFSDVGILAPHFVDCDFERCNFFRADLRSGHFEKTNLDYADLREANLKLVRFRNVNMREADLRGADLREAELVNVDIDGSLWLEEDIQRLEKQIKTARFEYLILEGKNKAKKVVYRGELYRRKREQP